MAKMFDIKKCQKDYIGQFDQDNYEGYDQKLMQDRERYSAKEVNNFTTIQTTAQKM